MKKLSFILCLTIVGLWSLAQGVSAGQVYPQSQMHPIFVTLPARGVNYFTLGSKANVTIPFFTN